MYSPGTCPNVPPSADAASTTFSIAGSTRARSTEIVSVTWPSALRLPSCRTAPEACAGWL